MSKKAPGPSPPPKRTAEDRKFFDLLKKLVRVPKEEVNALETQRTKRKRRGQRPKR